MKKDLDSDLMFIMKFVFEYELNFRWEAVKAFEEKNEYFIFHRKNKMEILFDFLNFRIYTSLREKGYAITRKEVNAYVGKLWLDLENN